MRDPDDTPADGTSVRALALSGCRCGLRNGQPSRH